MLNKIIGKLKLGHANVCAFLLLLLTSVQSFAAAGDGLTAPADTGEKLVGYIEANFGMVITVVIASVAVGIIISMFKRAH